MTAYGLALPETPTSAPALLWQAGFFDCSGYSDEARNFIYASESTGLLAAARDWPSWPEEVVLPAGRRQALERALARPLPLSPYIEVIHKTIPPASRVRLHRETGPTVLRTMFETDALPPGWAEAIAKYDRIWVPSAFNVTTFIRAGVPPAKIRTLPQTLDFELYQRTAEPLPLAGDLRPIRFLSVLEFSERKGWRHLVDAWAQAFRPTDDVSLIIKASTRLMGGGTVEERIKRRLRGRRTAQIHVITDPLSAVDIVRLYRACTAFVLPSRGEGWGRPYMEAMAVGLPTIGSRWGGNMAFMSDENAFLVSGEVVPVEPGDLVFERYLGQRWFDPDRTELVEALQKVAGGGSDVERRAIRAAREIQDRFAHEKIGACLRRLSVDELAETATR